MFLHKKNNTNFYTSFSIRLILRDFLVNKFPIENSVESSKLIFNQLLPQQFYNEKKKVLNQIVELL